MSDFRQTWDQNLPSEAIGSNDVPETRIQPEQTSGEEKTFQELYCEDYRLKPKKFECVLLRRSLHLNGMLCYPLIRIIFPGYFRMDREFIRRLGASRSISEAKTIYSDFSSLPYNETFSRRVLCVRVSKRHTLAIAAHTLPLPEPEPMSLPRREQMPNSEEPKRRHFGKWF